MRDGSMNPDRRTVIKSIGTVGVAGAFAGCTGNGGGNGNGNGGNGNGNGGNGNGNGGNGNGNGGGGFTDITALGGITGGSGYQHCLAFQQVIEGNMEQTRVTVSGTDGWGWNATNMYELGRDEMGIVPAGNAYDILHGVGDYQEENNYIAQVYPAHPPTYLHGVALEEKGIETYADLEGQRVNVLSRGSQTENLVPQMLDALDIEPGELMYLPHDEAASQLQQDGIDVAMASGVASPYMEVSQTASVQVVGISEDQQDPINEVMPWMGFATADFSALGYSGTGETFVPAPWTIMAGQVSLDNDLVYNLLDTMWSNIDMYTQIYDAAEGIAPEMVVDANIPIHPGAVEYYDEAGVDIPDSLRVESSDALPLEE